MPANELIKSKVVMFPSRPHTGFNFVRLSQLRFRFKWLKGTNSLMNFNKVCLVGLQACKLRRIRPDSYFVILRSFL